MKKIKAAILGIQGGFKKNVDDLRLTRATMAAKFQHAFKTKISPGEDHSRYKGASGNGKLRRVEKKIFLIDSHKARKNWNQHFISLTQKMI